MPVNIAIIDQSCLIRKQLREMLYDYSDFCVVFDSGCITETLTYQFLWTIDVAILDIRTCHGALQFVIEALKQSRHTIHVIALTDQSDSVYNSFARSLGVEILIDKANEYTKLPAAILTCCQDDERFTDTVERTVVHHRPQ